MIILAMQSMPLSAILLQLTLRHNICLVAWDMCTSLGLIWNYFKLTPWNYWCNVIDGMTCLRQLHDLDVHVIERALFRNLIDNSLRLYHSKPRLARIKGLCPIPLHGGLGLVQKQGRNQDLNLGGQSMNQKNFMWHDLLKNNNNNGRQKIALYYLNI